MESKFFMKMVDHDWLTMTGPHAFGDKSVSRCVQVGSKFLMNASALISGTWWFFAPRWSTPDADAYAVFESLPSLNGSGHWPGGYPLA